MMTKVKLVLERGNKEEARKKRQEEFRRTIGLLKKESVDLEEESTVPYNEQVDDFDLNSLDDIAVIVSSICAYCIEKDINTRLGVFINDDHYYTFYAGDDTDSQMEILVDLQKRLYHLILCKNEHEVEKMNNIYYGINNMRFNTPLTPYVPYRGSFMYPGSMTYQGPIGGAYYGANNMYSSNNSPKNDNELLESIDSLITALKKFRLELSK